MKNTIFFVLMVVLTALALAWIFFGYSLSEPTEGELGACTEYPEPLILVDMNNRSVWDQCYNPEIEQYVQCVPIGVGCK